MMVNLHSASIFSNIEDYLQCECIFSLLWDDSVVTKSGANQFTTFDKLSLFGWRALTTSVPRPYVPMKSLVEKRQYGT